MIHDTIHTASNKMIQYTAGYKLHAEGPIPHTSTYVVSYIEKTVGKL